ncbi:spore coat U domain-containing protein [Pseudochrobactrum sp. MP213Fo]|uniref:Csu type fimbrial protein n=1 Tax=Pseudochrobactrum sp. MP213Fo TaxID=3022250 RepID=UPI003BA29CA9
MQLPNLLRSGRHRSIQNTSMIFAPFGMVGLIVSGVLLSQSAPAAAGGGVCNLKSIGNFGNTVVDILANVNASATSQVEYNCNSPSKFNSIQFCTYIQAADSTQGSAIGNNTFYQARDNNAQLAWQMTLPEGGNTPIENFVGSKSTVGWTHYTNGSSSNQNTIASQQLTLRYLDRQHQDRVQSGVYNSAYQLITQYKFNDNAQSSSCASGIASPDGTIISDFMVTATVTKNCVMENFQDIDFGSQDSIEIASNNTGQHRAYGNIGIRCTYNTPYNISISKGNNFKDGIAQLKNGKNHLPYQLFQAGCKTPWDDKNTLSGNGKAVNIVDNHQVCAEIITPLSIAPAPGTYNDVVTVTATF